jgi:site-specific DNA-methyltransferase (adenine-specific)
MGKGIPAIEAGSNPHQGRWPANLIHDGSDEVVGLFPESKGQCGDVRGTEQSHTGDENTSCYGEYNRIATPKRGDSGSAARFFYTAKADSTERNKHLIEKNKHPTVKPVDLLQYLCRLITPPKGIILDPFCGSGSTGVAAFEEGFNYILIDKDPESCKTAKVRCAGKRLGDF